MTQPKAPDHLVEQISEVLKVAINGAFETYSKSMIAALRRQQDKLVDEISACFPRKYIRPGQLPDYLNMSENHLRMIREYYPFPRARDLHGVEVYLAEELDEWVKLQDLAEDDSSKWPAADAKGKGDED